MRRLGHFAIRDLVERIDALAFGIERVHEMHGDVVCVSLRPVELLWVGFPVSTGLCLGVQRRILIFAGDRISAQASGQDVGV